MPSPSDAVVIERVRFLCGGLGLEGRFAYPEAGRPAGAAVLAGPHPLLGGDLGNNVVAGLLDGLARAGVAALAFNYRGVGGSDGPAAGPDRVAEFRATAHVPEERLYADDLRAAAAAVGGMAGPGLPLALVGYSFGCSLLPAAGAAPGVPLALVAPTVGTHDYARVGALPNPRLVVAPDGDFAADAGLLTAWLDGMTGPKRVARGDWDGHFFRGHEARLARLVAGFLAEAWGAA